MSVTHQGLRRRRCYGGSEGLRMKDGWFARMIRWTSAVCFSSSHVAVAASWTSIFESTAMACPFKGSFWTASDRARLPFSSSPKAEGLHATFVTHAACPVRERQHKREASLVLAADAPGFPLMPRPSSINMTQSQHLLWADRSQTRNAHLAERGRGFRRSL